MPPRMRAYPEHVWDMDYTIGQGITNAAQFVMAKTLLVQSCPSARALDSTLSATIHLGKGETLF